MPDDEAQSGVIMPERPHGVEPPRGLPNTPRQRSYDGRFGRLFQDLADEPAHDPTDIGHVQELRTVAAAMTESAGDGGDNPTIPAGYVYLGQFIDHDITFDPTSALDRRNDPEGLINFRTPRFDLDSVYGSGPFDEPFQYQADGSHAGFALLVEDRGGPDLPRNAQQRALIGDPRNDENGIVSQLHVAFLRLHNRLMDDLQAQLPDARTRFAEAQRQAQWHYQWVVVHDFLRRTIGADLHDRLLVTTNEDGGARESTRLRHYRHKINPYLPVEFSAAAYRFGHSQVRDEYNINRTFRRRLFDPSGDDFRGFQALRPGWHASWPFFFELDGQPPQLSRRIDANLAPSLTTLQGASGDDANLPLRNLLRGAALGLPSGEAVARRMSLSPLPPQHLAPATAGRTPLWFYVLREAQVLHAGEHLGPVGGRIVGETLLGLLRADQQSYLQLDPTWQPKLPARSGDARSFDMADLLTYACEDQSRRF
jgi:hypothetical protein